MHPQLMGSPGFGQGLHERKALVDAQDFEVGLSWLASAAYLFAYPFSMSQIAAPIHRVPRAPIGASRDGRNRLVVLGHRSVLKLLHQCGSRVAISSE